MRPFLCGDARRIADNSGGMNLRTLAWKVAVMAAGALTLQAHPGHAPLSEGAKHFVTSPVHFMPALIFAVIVAVAAQFLKRRTERNFARAIAGAIALFAIVG
jgi:hypothetical protein